MIREFATKHRFKTSVSGDGETVVRGKFGEIYEWNDTTLAVLFMPDVHNRHPDRSWARKWGSLRDAGIAAGLVPCQSGDAEGSFKFTTSSKDQVNAAIALAGVKPKRKVTPEQAMAAATRFAAARAAKANQPAQI